MNSSKDTFQTMLESLGISPRVTGVAYALTQDAEFKDAIVRIHDSHKCSTLAAYEFVFIVFLWIFRAWRLGKVNTVLTRIWTQAWIAVLYWVVAVTVIPYLVWGNDYLTGVTHFARAFFRHFLT